MTYHFNLLYPFENYFQVGNSSEPAETIRKLESIFPTNEVRFISTRNSFGEFAAYTFFSYSPVFIPVNQT
jgi:hypothetical protein